MNAARIPMLLCFGAALAMTGLTAERVSADQLVKIRILHPITGQPVPMASARIFKYSANQWTHGNPAIAGGVWTQQLAAGSYKVQARGFGMLSTEQVFTVAAQPLTVNITVGMIRQPVTIRILHPDTGKLVKHASLRIYSRAKKKWILGTTISGGVWSGKLEPGHYRVQGKGANLYSVERSLLVGDVPASLSLIAKTAP